ncbi:hypothetical protein Y032_0171g319 [Ancylostoma ceylanicum]|uniref:Uncharacterized protein n=1 Tax=Ancylostoma ceylanicum TaxID=53326 RepID=A0A016SVR9_9BILA|nr:hypothetical protein Y032_0171g319 [Ancylostoma ceylanicum]
MQVEMNPPPVVPGGGPKIVGHLPPTIERRSPTCPCSCPPSALLVPADGGTTGVMRLFLDVQKRSPTQKVGGAMGVLPAHHPHGCLSQ